MKRINPEGCQRCETPGWKHEPITFCACSCHNGGPTEREKLEAQGFELGAQWYSYDNGLTVPAGTGGAWAVPQSVPWRPGASAPGRKY